MPSRPPDPSVADIKRRVINAICTLYRHDLELLDLGVSERSVTHKLAEYLAVEFPSWRVDCEYNRHGHEIKRLRVDADFWHTRADDTEAKTVFPDIVIHRRNTDQNLVVIEAKKGNGPDDATDIKKLEAFTDEPEYRYKYGLLLRLAPDGCSKLDLYQDGSLKHSWTKAVQSALEELGNGG